MGRVHQIGLAAALLLPAAAQETPVFRADVRLVRLLATVKDPNGNLIGTLSRSNFRVFDNSVEQQIAVFERQTEQPLSVSILIDNSGSTAKDLKYEIDSVTRFLRSLFKEGHPQDQAAIYSFNWQVVLLKNFTRRIESLESVLRGLRGEAGTSLYDAMYLAAGDLAERPGRHVMIIVTDGGDTTSSKKFHDALEAAQLADAVVYPILVMPITNDAGRNIGGENALTTIAAGSGGRVFAPSLGPQLDDVFSEILTDLRTQYLIGYYPKNVPPSKDRFHRLKLTVDRPALQVSTRSGYYSDTVP
jgi:Ca-activated chloride channel family protein